MNTKKVNTISWWDDNARTSPLEKPTKDADLNASENGADANGGIPQQGMMQGMNPGQNPYGQYPAGQMGMAMPMIQPLVVVPYSTTMPMNPTYGEVKKGKYFEDLYGEDEGAQQSAISNVKLSSGKRSGAFIAMIVCAVLILAAAALGIFVAPAAGYVSIYNIEGERDTTSVSIADPVFSFIASKVDAFDPQAMKLPSSFKSYLEYTGDNIFTKIAVIALPVAIAIYLILTIAVLIAAIAGLCGRNRGERGYAKVKLGAVAIVMFLCAGIATIGGFAVTGGVLSGIVDYLIGSFVDNFAACVAGYGLFLMLIVPIVIFICTSCAYKRNNYQSLTDREE